MSWAVEDWAAGLPGRALQKVRELQSQHERLQREKQQRQLQLDSTETALSKQKQKFEEVRLELAGVRRDLQSSREEAQAGARARERLSQELQVKQAQVCSLEGQLDGARSLSHSLTQEVKRLEAELEKLQNTSSSGDSALFSTPCWNMSSASEHSGSRREGKDKPGGDAEVKALHIRQQLQFADRSPIPMPSSFSRQAQSTPPSHRQNWQADFSTPSAVFPWERGDASSVPKGRPASLAPPSSDVIDHCNPKRSEEAADVRKENDVQRSKILELQTWVQSLEQDVRSASDRHRESEARLVEVRRELASRDQNLSRAKEQLERANSCVEKEKDRTQMMEQRVKQLQEELGCQRQNAESSRHSAEQRRKELERDHQKELLELQKESQSREKQHQQESSRLNQDLQQARTLHNTLQAQCDKVSLQKQVVEKDLESVKGKLQWAEKELEEGRRREAQIQCRLTEALREKDSLGLSLEQSNQRLKTLEEEVKRLTQGLAEALKSFSEMQSQLAVPATPMVPARFTPAGDSFSCSVTPNHERPHCPTRVQKKKASRPDRLREEEQEQRAKYPKDREPGEGIDSDFIEEFGSEEPHNPKGEAGRERSEEDRRGSVTAEEEEEKGEIKTCLVKGNQTCVHEMSVSMKGQNDARDDQGSMTPKGVNMLTKDEKQGDNNGDSDGQTKSVDIESRDSSISLTGAKGQHNPPSLQDLNKENAALRDDLREAMRELELRLEDLETQRRAEAEARTKLKQLSRKHSSQAEKLRQKIQELKEEGGRLERALEEERLESARLREALREERIEKEREDEERVESGKMRVDLAELESELRREQEEREREKQERENDRLKDEEGRRALTERLAELEELQRCSKREGKNGNEEGENPLAPLTLECSTNQKNSVASNKGDGVIPSPDERIPLSHSVNQEKTKTLEKGELDLITKEGTKVSKPPGESRGAALGKPVIGSSEVQAKPEKALDSDETTLLVLEVEHLRRTCETLQGERNREAGKAKQTQARLEVLQSQVTNQTRQLTLAFENQSSHIEDLLAELQDRDSTIQWLDEELQDCRAKMAEQKAEKHELKVGNEGFGKTENTELDQQNSEKPRQRVTADIEAQQTADKGTRQEFGPTPLSLPLTRQGTLGINNDGCLRDLEAELRDLKAENKQLRSKLSAAALLKELSCIGTEPIAVSEDCATLRRVAELPSVEKDQRQLGGENEEPKSTLSRVEFLSKQENHPLDSEVKRGLGCDRQQHSIFSGHFGTEDTQAKRREEAPACRESLLEQRENEELKSNLESALSFTGIMLPTASAGQKGDAGSTSSKRPEFDTSTVLHRSAIHTLQAENQALRCWALSLCPPDRLGELAAVTEGGLRQGTRCELSARCNKSSAGADLSEAKSAGSESMVIRQQGGLSDAATLRSLKSAPAPEPTGHQGNDEPSLESGKDQTEPIQAEPCLKSWDVDGTAQQLSFTEGPGTEENRFSSSRVMALQEQLVDLRSQVSSLQEENARQAEELQVWRVAGDPIPPLLVGETTIHPRIGSITVVHEDRLLLTCRGSKLVGSRPTAGDVQVESVGQDAFERFTAPAERGASEDGESLGHLKPAGRTLELLRGTGRLPTTKVLATDVDILIDLKTKAMAHKGMDEGTETRKNPDNDISHPGSVTEESAENSKEIHYRVAGKQTKEMDSTHRDDQEKGSSYRDSKSKATGCRITEDHIRTAYCEDNRAKTECKATAVDQRGNRATLMESALTQIDKGTLKEGAGAASESVELVKQTQGVESASQKIKFPILSTEDCSTGSRKTQKSGNSFLEGKGMEIQTTKTISITEDTQIYHVQTITQTENKPVLKSGSPLCTEVETTAGKTLTKHHRPLQDSTKDVLKLICDRAENGSKSLPSGYSALHWPQVVTRDFQTQTKVENESLAFRETRNGGDRENSVCKEVRSAATQTDGESGGTGRGNPAPSAGSQEVQHVSTQTEAGEVQHQDPEAGEGEDEESLDSPPLSPALVAEGGGVGGGLLSGSFPIPADPVRLAERIRRNRSRMSAAFDDTEYEPYGLPEVVMKGFADIPSGPACPYVLRRGLLGTSAMPLPLRECAEGEQDCPGSDVQTPSDGKT